MTKRREIHAWLPKAASTVMERRSGIDIWPLRLKKGATIFAVYLNILRLINRVNLVLPDVATVGNVTVQKHD